MSSRTLSGLKLSARISATVVNTLDDGGTVNANQPLFTFAPTLTTGLNANQANRGWHSEDRAIAAGAQEILDLHSLPDIGAGAGNDALGLDLVFEEITALAIVNENAVGTVGHLEIAPSSSEGWGPIGSHTVANGGALLGQGMLMMSQLAADGFDVGEQLHRITLKAVGGAVTYSIYILGRHDDEESSSSSSSSSSMSSSSSSSSSSISTSSQSTSQSSISTSSSSQSSISTSSSSQSSPSSSSQSESSSSLSSS